MLAKTSTNYSDIGRKSIFLRVGFARCGETRQDKTHTQIILKREASRYRPLYKGDTRRRVRSELERKQFVLRLQ